MDLYITNNVNSVGNPNQKLNFISGGFVVKVNGLRIFSCCSLGANRPQYITLSARSFVHKDS